MEIQVSPDIIGGKVENKLQTKEWWGTDELFTYILS